MYEQLPHFDFRENEANYLIRDYKQIISHLSELKRRKCIICAEFGEPRQSLLTTIVEIDTKKYELILGNGC